MKKLLRKNAIASGQPKYYTGVPCKHGHVAARDTITGNCEVCHRINAAASVRRQRERIRKILRA